ncbi:spore germination protein [Bacillus mesophilus]|uniref:Ger(X)C family spore germination protein n=1 Tax=Bacillus mesophilus TaxID=1808955 RepID=A0A6M0QBL7_9BACI|nr:Ger(x)C family spore germination protein [Bacillus mesophilus]MBM7660070.1 spore germination protein [Bacillus mesophilus]NEY73725.1 Ger(x)C family spore germination protein [Bacillus mesophilus]
MDKLFITFSILLFLTGCAERIEQPSLEDIGMVGSMGFDVAEDDKIRVTISLPLPGQGDNGEIQFTENVTLAHEAIRALSRVSDRDLSVAQLRTVLFSEEFAKEVGLKKITHYLYRNPMVGDTVFIAVVKGKAEDILTKKYKANKSNSEYLNNLLHPRSSTAFHPFTTLHDFTFYKTSETGDPMTPYLEDTIEGLRISKVALFDYDKMIKTLDPEEALIASALHDDRTLADMKLNLEGDEEDSFENQIMLNFVQSKVKITSNGSLEKPFFNIKLQLTANVLEYHGPLQLDQDSDINNLEERINKELKSRAEKTIEGFKEAGVDPVLLGEHLRAHISQDEWTKDKWKEALPKMTYEVDVITEIKNSGTIR